MRVIGVDGCGAAGPDGWVGALVDLDGGTQVGWRLVTIAGDLLDWADEAGAAALGVDIPIGLPEREFRELDRRAKPLLGTAGSSVFLTPPRPVVQEQTYEVANAHCRQLTGSGISRQAFGLFDRIRSVDRLLDASGWHDRAVEVHPELSFRELAEPGRTRRLLTARPDPARPSSPVSEGKKTARGVGQRIGALRAWVDPVPRLADVPPRVPLDDALDALVAAWSAHRWVRGEAVLVTADRPYDGRGRPMRMVV